jgi:hypothetical protein
LINPFILLPCSSVFCCVFPLADEDDGEAGEVESSPEFKARPAPAQRPGRRQLPSRSGPGTGAGMRGGQQLQRSPQGIAAGPGPIKHSLALSAFASP